VFTSITATIPSCSKWSTKREFTDDQASSPAPTDFAEAEASSGDPATQDLSDDPTAADDDWDRDGSDQDVDVADAASDDSFEGDDTNATRLGTHVHWARDAAEHNAIVYEILSARGVTSLIKSKSMLQEECGMTPYLQQRGIEVTESDLGERIQQLSNEPPSHIVVPAIHKLRSDVAELFAEKIGSDARQASSSTMYTVGCAISGRRPSRETSCGGP
jgi:LUD domain